MNNNEKRFVAQKLAETMARLLNPKEAPLGLQLCGKAQAYANVLQQFDEISMQCYFRLTTRLVDRHAKLQRTFAGIKN